MCGICAGAGICRHSIWARNNRWFSRCVLRITQQKHTVSLALSFLSKICRPRFGCGIVATAHPKKPDQPLAGGPQMVEVSRDGKRIYFTNSLYAAWDEQFYPDGVGSWMVKLDAGPNGGMEFDQNFFLESNDYRVHQVRLEGGDSSSDSFCFP